MRCYVEQDIVKNGWLRTTETAWKGDISVFLFAAGEDSVFKDEFINNSSHLVARGSLSEKLTIFVL